MWQNLIQSLNLSGIADGRLGKTIANIGVFAGRIFAPHQANRDNDRLQRKLVETDDAEDDDNTLSLTVSWIKLRLQSNTNLWPEMDVVKCKLHFDKGHEVSC